jgi:hypothetical protein
VFLGVRGNGMGWVNMRLGPSILVLVNLNSAQNHEISSKKVQVVRTQQVRYHSQNIETTFHLQVIA